jgi:hypothetical protein
MNRLIKMVSLKVWGSTMLLVVLALSLCTTNVMAFGVDLGNDVKLELDTTLSYSSAWRVEDPETSLLGSSGNAEFDSGDQALSAFGLLVDADLSWKEYGAFLRGRTLYDTVYTDDKFHPKTQDRHGEDTEILDAFVYGNFELGGAPVTLRAGRQAVFWGESLLVFGSIATALNPLDTTKANAPGVEAKELIMPTGQVYGQISTPDSKLTLASFYKWEWESSRFDESGSYFSTNDALDEAGEFILHPGIPRGDDVDADDDGEYGVALRYLADNGDEVGLFFANYHENMPLLNINVTGFLPSPPYPAGIPVGTYNLEYQEDVQLYGATYSTVFGDTNVAAEVSYRDNLKVGMATMLPSYQEAQFLQVQVSAFHVFGDLGIADSALLAAEWGYNEVLDFDENELAADKRATGGKVKFTMDYFNVANGLDLQVPIALAYNPEGVTSYAISGFNKGAHSASIGADFTYLGVYKAGVNYTTFFGDAEDNNKTDRDYIALNLKYTF